MCDPLPALPEDGKDIVGREYKIVLFTSRRMDLRSSAGCILDKNQAYTANKECIEEDKT